VKPQTPFESYEARNIETFKSQIINWLKHILFSTIVYGKLYSISGHLDVSTNSSNTQKNLPLEKEGKVLIKILMTDYYSL